MELMEPPKSHHGTFMEPHGTLMEPFTVFMELFKKLQTWLEDRGSTLGSVTYLISDIFIEFHENIFFDGPPKNIDM